MFPYSRLGFKLLKVRGYSLQPLWSIWYQEKNHDLVVTPLGIFLQTGDPIGLLKYKGNYVTFQKFLLFPTNQLSPQVTQTSVSRGAAGVPSGLAKASRNSSSP